MVGLDVWDCQNTSMCLKGRAFSGHLTCLQIKCRVHCSTEHQKLHCIHHLNTQKTQYSSPITKQRLLYHVNPRIHYKISLLIFKT